MPLGPFIGADKDMAFKGDGHGLAVNLFPMADVKDDHFEHAMNDLIDNAIGPNSVFITPFQLTTEWDAIVGVFGQMLNGSGHMTGHLGLGAGELS